MVVYYYISLLHWYMVTSITILYFSHHVIPLIGVNHLIVFETNRKPFSRSHSWNACRFLLFNSPLPRSPLSSFRVTFVHLRFFLWRTFLLIWKRIKERGETEIRSLDPWNDKLLCWPLDHAAPPLLPQTLKCVRNRNDNKLISFKWNVKTLVWWDSNLSYFAALFCFCLGFNALLASPRSEGLQ